MRSFVLSKIKDGFISILPIYLIVIILNFTPFISLETYDILIFSFATVLAGFGIALFNMGSDLAMTPMGRISGAVLTRQGKLWLLLIFIFVLGFFVTLAEPNLAILGSQLKGLLDSNVITVAVAFGVGIALILLVLRSIHKTNLAQIFLFLYGLAFGLSILVVYVGNNDFLGFIFDSGGVTTGPVTVPFMMAICIGISSVLARKADKDMSFGLIGIVSIMSIIVMLLLGMFIKYEGTFELDTLLYVIDSDFLSSFLTNLWDSFTSVLLSVALIYAFFLVINFLFIKINKTRLIKITIGVVYSLFGLTFFLTAVNLAYMPIAYSIGMDLANNKLVLYIIGFIIGAVSVIAEPAVHVLVKQVNEITDGIIKKKTMLISLIIGVGISIILAILHVVLDFDIMFILVPALVIALGLSFFIPKIYVGVTFDSGGVAAGALTSGFVLPFAIGTCAGLGYIGSDILRLGFGVVALVSITPVIVIEFIGLQSLIKDRLHVRRQVGKLVQADDEVIIKF